MLTYSQNNHRLLLLVVPLASLKFFTKYLEEVIDRV